MRVAILTASDKGSRGEREDLSAVAIREMVATIGAEVVAYDVVPDEQEILSAKLIEYTDTLGVDLVLTTGGTGLAPRDVIPEATLTVVSRVIPGIPEAMRAAGMQHTPHSMLSRAVAGSRGRTLIVNLPGSPRAVRENLAVILPALPHALGILQGSAGECARPDVRHPRAAFLGPQQPALRLIEILPRSPQEPYGSCKPLSNPDQPLLDRSGIPSEPARTFRLLQTPAEPQPVCARPVWIHPLEPAITLTPAFADLPREYLFRPAKTFARLLQISFQDNPYISRPAVVLARLL